MISILLAAALAASSGTGSKTTSTKSKPSTTKPAPATDLPMPPPPEPKPAPPAEAAAEPTPPAEKPAARKYGPEVAARAPTVGPGLGSGFSFNGGPTVLRIGVRGGLTLMQLESKIELQAYVPLHLAYASTTVASGFGSNITTTIWGFEMLPTARLVGPLMPKLNLYGDMGLGLIFYQVSTPFPFYGVVTGNSAGVGIRLAGGLEYALTDHLSIVAEPIGLLFNLASNVTYTIGNTQVTASSGSGAQWMMWLGATYRL